MQVTDSRPGRSIRGDRRQRLHLEFVVEPGPVEPVEQFPARIGDRVVLAGQCGVNDNIFIGDDVIAGGATKIFTNVPAGRVLLGYPAVKMEAHVEMQKALRRLPRLAARVAALEKGEAGGE